MTTEDADKLGLGKILGAHEARLSAVEHRLISMETDLRTQLQGIRAVLDQMRRDADQVRGGWKTLVWIGTSIGAAIGVIATTLGWMHR